MSDSLYFVKTQKGKDALDNRSAALTGKLRSLLLLVDGRKSRAELEALAGQIGSGATALGELEKLGFIALGENALTRDATRAAPAADEDRTVTVRIAKNSIDRFVQAQRFMQATLKDAGCAETEIAQSVNSASTMMELTAAYEGFVALIEAKNGGGAVGVGARLRAMLV